MPKTKPYRGAPMEGAIAQLYAKNTARSLDEFKALAKAIRAELPVGGRVLEIAPGPGYLAVELARQGFEVSALDISHSFVRIARDLAASAGVKVDVRQGDAAHQPFADHAFDFVVCRAAFKNFEDPDGALKEMHRVLAPGGRALIIDMRRDAEAKAISAEVALMKLGPISSAITELVLRSLRKRAYSRDDFLHMAAETPFGAPDIRQDGIGFQVRLSRSA